MFSERRNEKRSLPPPSACCSMLVSCILYITRPQFGTQLFKFARTQAFVWLHPVIYTVGLRDHEEGKGIRKTKTTTASVTNQLSHVEKGIEKTKDGRNSSSATLSSVFLAQCVYSIATQYAYITNSNDAANLYRTPVCNCISFRQLSEGTV